MPLQRLATVCSQVAAGAGASMLGWLAVADWRSATANAAAAMTFVGFVGGSVVGAIIYLVRKFDDLRLERRRRIDEFNKTSLSAQNAEMIANQKSMRDTLHKINNQAQKAESENANLRDDLSVLRTHFMAVSEQLHKTDLQLHAAREEMHRAADELKRTAERLVESERDRALLRTELATIRLDQAGQGRRLDALENPGSGDSIPIVGGPSAPPVVLKGLVP